MDPPIGFQSHRKTIVGVDTCLLEPDAVSSAMLEPCVAVVPAVHHVIDHLLASTLAFSSDSLGVTRTKNGEMKMVDECNHCAHEYVYSTMNVGELLLREGQ